MSGPARDVRAWACSFCGKLAPRNKHGKRLAEECCVCAECHVNPARRTGHGNICRQCGAKKELAAAEENMKWAEERLARARSNQNGAV